MPFHLSPVLVRELLFLVGGIIIGMTIMLFVIDRHEKRMIDRHMKQLDGLMLQINELSRKQQPAEERSQERPSA